MAEPMLRPGLLIAVLASAAFAAGSLPAAAGSDVLASACGSAAVTGAGGAALLSSTAILDPGAASAADTEYKSAASITLPAGCFGGAQAKFTGADGAAVMGGEAYLAYPGAVLGLAGAVADPVAGEDGGGAQAWKVGPQAAYSMGDVTVQGWAGLAEAGGLSPKPFAQGGVAYYASDDLRISMGLRHDLDSDTALVGAEWQPHSGLPMSLFAEGSASNGDGSALVGGLRWYFGGAPDTLKQRDDKSSFVSRLFNIFGGR